ncbi:phosphatidylinositol-specific phospholipase C domain-containing protein [Undibacterium pigrum]|uniref:1-phosphatidylinositol phosphodiesterase n=1 Tax=Undibacterium pigrum TaxID=401470 RepID=A0A318IX91_9BURK|nr:phosphatidylinositol-specific phospholipase C domain-containing protein [Undibacterium pigrum]PXX38577.1 phosphatidylinositol-specific phospholipase C-like protein [Undibacterium pigrum]
MTSTVAVYQHSAKQPERYFYDKLDYNNQDWTAGTLAFGACATPVPGTISIYTQVATNPYRNRFSTQPEADGEWSQGEFAFYAYTSQQPGTVPIYQHLAASPARYLYDTLEDGRGIWGAGKTVFYAAPPLVSWRRHWMGALIAQTATAPLITNVNLPGTHDTGTWAVVHEKASKCQTMDLATQLAMGIRFIDIRLYPGTNPATGQKDLKVWHGPTDCGIWFSDIVATCNQFLDGSLETIVMSVKLESKEIFNTEFLQILEDHFLANTWKINAPATRLFNVEENAQNILATAGQIVLFRRYEYDPADPARKHIGIDAAGWPDDDLTRMPTPKPVPKMIQDAYQFAVGTTAGKWAMVNDFLEMAKADKNDVWYINFSSAAGGAYPSYYSDRVNPHLQEYMEKEVANASPVTKKYGSILMDFPTPRMIDAIVASNLYYDNKVLRPHRPYYFAVGSTKDYALGQPHKVAGWNYPMAVTDTKVAHVLIKINGTPGQEGEIHVGDIVMIQCPQFTNDIYIYIESKGSKNGDGIDLFYDQENAPEYGNKNEVYWRVERNPGDSNQKSIIAPGDNVRFKSVSSTQDQYLCATTNAYLGAVDIKNYNPNDLIAGGFEFYLTVV